MKKTFFIFLTFIMFILLLEMFVRILGFEEEINRKKYSYNNKFGHFVNGSSWYKGLKKDSEKVTFRGKGFTRKKKKGVKRFLFIGDSGTFGVGLGAHVTFPAVFEKHLIENNYQEFEVINAGVIGFNTVNAYQFLKHWLLKLEPNYVVLTIFMPNDINFNIGNRRELIENNFFDQAMQVLKQNSALATLIYTRMLVLSSKIDHEFDTSEEGFWHQPGFKTKNNLQLINYEEGELALYLKEEDPIVTEAYGILKDLFYGFRDLSENFDFKFVITMVPSASDIMDKFTMLAPNHIVDRMYDFGKDEDFDFNLPRKKVMSLCKEVELTCFDNIAKFEEFGLKTLIPKDDHLSWLGHKITGDALYFKMKGAGILD